MSHNLMNHNGDCYKSASNIIFSNDGFLLACYGSNHLVNYTVNGSKVHDTKGTACSVPLRTNHSEYPYDRGTGTGTYVYVSE